MENIIKKWWFWIITFLTIVTICGFVIIGKQYIENNNHTSYISSIKDINKDIIVYFSKDKNSILIEINNLDTSGSDTKKIESITKEYYESGKLKYSKLIIYFYNKDTYITKGVYKVPSMEQIIDEEILFIKTK